MVEVLEDLFNEYWRYTPIALIPKAGMPKIMARMASVEIIDECIRIDLKSPWSYWLSPSLARLRGLSEARINLISEQ